MNLSDLEAKAKAATPGPWHSHYCFQGKRTDCWCKVVGTSENVNDDRMDAIVSSASISAPNADFIAAANPSVVLSLTAQVEARDKMLERARIYLDALKIAVSDTHGIHRWLSDLAALSEGEK